MAGNRVGVSGSVPTKPYALHEVTCEHPVAGSAVVLTRFLEFGTECEPSSIYYEL